MTSKAGRAGRWAAPWVCLGFTGVLLGDAARAHAGDRDAPSTPPPPTVEATLGAAMAGRGPAAGDASDAGELLAALDDAAATPRDPADGPATTTAGLGAALHDVPRGGPGLPLPPPATGPTARVGSSVGYVYNNPLDVLALGGQVSAGYRFDRFVGEVEYAYYRFQSHGAFPIDLGHAHRLGVLGRLDVLRSAPGSLGKNSRLAAYAELGAARQANLWDRPRPWEPARDVPANTTHTEGTVGLGVRIDHGTRYPVGFPSRIGWLIGWRMVTAPHDPVPMSLCRGEVSCVQKPTMTPTPTTEYGTALLFQTSLEATW